MAESLFSKKKFKSWNSIKISIFRKIFRSGYFVEIFWVFASQEVFASQVFTQLTFACSKSTIETLEKGVKYFLFKKI